MDGEHGTNHQSRPDEQYERKGDFGDDHGVTCEYLTNSGADAPAALLESGDKLSAADMQRGRQTEHECSEEGDTEAKQEDRPVDDDLGLVRNRARRHDGNDGAQDAESHDRSESACEG